MKEDGYIVVETVGAFVPFIFLIASILSLVNIVTLQTRIHYALTQAANTVSMYCYTLEAFNVADKLMRLDAEHDKVQDELNRMKTGFIGLMESIDDLSILSGSHDALSAPERPLGLLEGVADDPAEVVQKLINYGLGEGAGILFAELVRPLVGRYLSNGSLTGDEYLTRVNVTGGLNALSFYEFDPLSLHSTGHGGSTILDSSGSVILVVQYDIEYKFGSLPLPFKPTMHVTQTVATKAWLGGQGTGYW